MNLTIGVKYSCHLCGLKDIEVQIPARETEDVLAWMHQVLEPGVGADHQMRSPHCKPKTLKDVKIPMSGADRIGGATAQ